MIFREAELTKDWLSKVRKGWLSLLKPSINSWTDVFRALTALIRFTDGLEDQIYRVKQIPGIQHNRKLKNVLGVFRKILENRVSEAKHWYEVDKDPEGYGRGTFRKEDADHMFKLYQTKFEELLAAHVKSRGTKKNPYQTTRLASATEILDRILKILREEIKEEGGNAKTVEAFKQFYFHKMKVIVTDPKFHGQLIEKYVKSLDKTYQLLSKKGFSKLWYGFLFVESDAPKKLSPSELERYQAAGYFNLRSIGGSYSTKKDVIVLSDFPEGIPYDLTHELGHRYWYRVMTSEQRARFESLIKVKLPADTKIKIPESISKDVSKFEDEIHNNQLGIFDVLTKFRGGKVGPASKVEGLLFKKLTAFMKDIDTAYEALSAKTEIISRSDFQPVYSKFDETFKNLRVLLDPGKSEQELKEEWVGIALADVMEIEWLVYQALNSVRDRHEEEIKALKRKSKPHWDPKDLRVSPVSEYGATNPEEAFAEAFTHYVVGRDMDRDQIDSFKSVLTANTLVRRVARRYLDACKQ